MKLRLTPKFQWKNGENRLFYGCIAFPYCRALVGAHPDGKPFENFLLAEDNEHKALRKQGHQLFDTLYQKGYMSKGKAFGLLADCLGITPEQVHFSQFTKSQCLEAIRHLEYFWETAESEEERAIVLAKEFADMLNALPEISLGTTHYTKKELRAHIRKTKPLLQT